VDLREIRETETAEIGPVVHPAYDATTVSVRSLLAQLDPAEHRALLRELAAELRLAVDLEDFTGQPDARSAGGGEPTDAEPRNGATSNPFDDPESRDLLLRNLRVKGITP
jgi:hypothetical protein